MCSYGMCSLIASLHKIISSLFMLLDCLSLMVFGHLHIFEGILIHFRKQEHKEVEE